MAKPKETWGVFWTCRYCGKPIKGYTPKHGDGSIQVLYKHLDKEGVKCKNNRADEYDALEDTLIDPEEARL